MPILPIEIFSVYEMEEKLKLGSKLYSHCISIGSPGSTMPVFRNRFISILRLEFNDIYSKKDMPNDQSAKPPKMDSIKKIIKFYNETKDFATGYTIHCHAGVHRSVAVGMIILYLMNNSIEFVKNEIIKVKAFPLPNRKVLELFDRQYKSNLSSLIPELNERLAKFLNNDIEIKIDDYLEELDSVDE